MVKSHRSQVTGEMALLGHRRCGVDPDHDSTIASVVNADQSGSGADSTQKDGFGKLNSHSNWQIFAFIVFFCYYHIYYSTLNTRRV